MAYDERLDLEKKTFDDANHHRWHARYLLLLLEPVYQIAEKQENMDLALCPMMIAQDTQVCLSATILKQTDHPVYHR